MMGYVCVQICMNHCKRVCDVYVNTDMVVLSLLMTEMKCGLF